MDIAINHREDLHVADQRYAFLVHSADTLTNNLPPQVDNKPLARQRRRRTSPEDQAILEAEYRKNPKPDKAARMSIVQRVALGEKEVQIWFQNRRQSTRRKTRPLLPHEIAHYQQSKTLPRLSDSFGPDIQDHDIHEDENDQSDSALNDIPSADKSKANAGSGPITARKALAETSANERSMQNSRTSLDGQTNASKKLKRTRSSIRLSLGSDGSAKIVTGDSPSPPRKPLISAPTLTSPTEAEETLSQNSFKSCLEAPDKYSGRAEDSRSWAVVVDKNARNELEEHAKQDRSGSAAGAIGLMRSTSARRVMTPMSNSGARKRTSLSREPSMSKRIIAGVSNVGAGSNMVNSNHRRTPLFQRSQSLQNQRLLASASSHGSSPLIKASGISPRKFRKAASGLGIHLMSTMGGGGDSDKENWSPERDTEHGSGVADAGTGAGSGSATHGDAGLLTRTVAPRAVRLQPTPKTISTPAWTRHSSSMGRHRMMTSPAEPGSMRVHEDHAVDEDEEENSDEVAYFMRRRDDEDGIRERKSTSASTPGDEDEEEEELAGVQGLLSLSQGNWK